MVTGPGYVDCHLYRQHRRLILHLVNLTAARAWPEPVEEFLPAGPFEIVVKLPEEILPKQARLLVAGGKLPCDSRDGTCRVMLPSIVSHEVLVLE